jgi:DNA-binding GntR family transcriptional regulator
LLHSNITETDDESPLSAVRRSPLTDQVVAQITSRILSGELGPGTLLRQAQLAEQLAVSRTPLREALRVLLTDGLVIQQQNGTFTVVSPTLDDARDTYEMRGVIDAFAARMAAIRATDQQLAELEDLVIRIEASCDPFDGHRYLTAVSDYHVGLVKASGNRAILPLENAIRMSTRVLFPRFAQRQDRLIAAALEHRQLYEAIRDRDPDEAERLAQEHVNRVIAFWIDESAGTSPLTTESTPSIAEALAGNADR